jgi:hypothetical protein
MIRIRCRRDGEGIKAVARELGIAPNTVPEYRAQSLRQAAPPKRKPRPRVAMLERFCSHVDGLILSTRK